MKAYNHSHVHSCYCHLGGIYYCIRRIDFFADLFSEGNRFCCCYGDKSFDESIYWSPYCRAIDSGSLWCRGEMTLSDRRNCDGMMMGCNLRMMMDDVMTGNMVGLRCVLICGINLICNLHHSDSFEVLLCLYAVVLTLFSTLYFISTL